MPHASCPAPHDQATMLTSDSSNPRVIGANKVNSEYASMLLQRTLSASSHQFLQTRACDTFDLSEDSSNILLNSSGISRACGVFGSSLAGSFMTILQIRDKQSAN